MDIFIYIYRKFPAICCCAPQFLNMESEIIITLIGLGLLIAGIIKIREKSHLRNWGIKTEGIIYSLEQSRHDEVYYPVVRFKTKEQQWITRKLDFGTNPPRYAEGSKVNLIYDPDEPENVDIDGALQLIMVPVILLMAGIICWAYVVLLLFEVI